MSSNIAESQVYRLFDVTNNGTILPNDDITQSLLEGWTDACSSTSPSKVVVPKGIFKLSGATLQGPCNAPIEFSLQGILQAPPIDNHFKGGNTWIAFEYIDFLTISGGGIFDGQGKNTWGKECAENEYCGNLPINIRFNFVTNSIVQEVTSLDSKQFHVNVLGCKNLTFQHVKIIAAEDSPNTDGIHIGRSTEVKVLDSNIETGDDCVSIGEGSERITVAKVTCGPGHGISIGSLGKYPNEDPVNGVTVRNCVLKNTQNGVRIKTWPNSHEGMASQLHFEDIIMEDVGNPVLIDQEYCPWNQCDSKIPSRVQISDVSFKNIRGTSSTALAVKLVCSSGLPCRNVEMADIDLKYSGEEGPITSECKNVEPTVSGIQNPPACLTTTA
ncbi:Glycoside hydrolase [Parasponia andersonii]|uniref:Glycoside hydrolase n=1 Tax=Parasponia andersonii TaxID=3476 RepID=A0A2P5CRB6_PARAD|nr:Glycoside hydrolase [Parasponia andersonii]